MNTFLRQLLMIGVGLHVMLFLLDFSYTWTLSEFPLHGIKKNEAYDYVIVGDSRTLPLHAPYLSYITGKKVLNISSQAYILDDVSELLHYFFACGNKTEKIILQVDQKFGSRVRSIKKFIYVPYLLREHYSEFHYPFKFYAENNKNITPPYLARNFIHDMIDERVDETIDSIHVRSNYYIENPRLNHDDSRSRFRIKDIIELRKYAQAHGVKELILYTPPNAPGWSKTQSNPDSFKYIVAHEGFKYYDFSNLYQDTSYFKDQVHLKVKKDFEYSRYVASRLLLTGKGPVQSSKLYK